jgi:hypothetical protein
MTAVFHERPDLLRLDYMVVPRWLRERRRLAARATEPTSVAREVADLLRPGRELTLAEIIRQQGVQPFDWEDYRARTRGLTSQDWAELRAAMRAGHER